MIKTKRVSRVIHVPLTDKEWKSLHDLAFLSGSTKGEVTAAAIRRELSGRAVAS